MANRPHPIIHVPTLESKVAILRLAHGLGYPWDATLDASIAGVSRWCDEDQARVSWVTFIKINGRRYTHWITINSRPDYTPEAGYTVMNSLAHLRAYLSRA